MRLAATSAVRVLLLAACVGGLLATSACATRGERGATTRSSDTAVRTPLPDMLASRWAPPAFATRQVAASRAAAFDAALAAVNELGYAVSRLDGAAGKLHATRRQSSGFDGAREYRLELSVVELSPESVDLRVVLREIVEDSAGRVSSGLVRDRAPYDAIFDRVPGAASVAPGR